MCSVLSIIAILVYDKNIDSISSISEEVTFEVKENATYSTLGKDLFDAGLIKSEFFYKIYIKINKPDKLYKGQYILNKNMSIEKIVSALSGVNSYNPDLILVTFKEGINMRKIASIIEENTENTKEDVLNLLKDDGYIKGLIDEYWFLDSVILDKNIYYPLEGYLFPDTYQISKKSTVKEIFKVMLNQTKKVLTDYKEDIESNKLSIHKIITLASMIELEAGNADDRKGVSGVFYNRLNGGWSLGSDVTTYYASKIDDWSYSLTYNELHDCSNKYNTRCPSFVGLPVGPIANPSKDSIIASINPTNHDYYYFVADCKGKTYLNYNSSGHSSTIAKLKADGNWCG